MNTEDIIRVLNGLTDAEDEHQLKRMDEAVCQLDAQPSLSAVEAMLSVFERFPDKDGFETFWALLHAIEASPDYQPKLLDSVRKVPGEFNVMMLNRILNSGVRKVGKVELLDVLQDVKQHPHSSASAREMAQRFIERHTKNIQK